MYTNKTINWTLTKLSVQFNWKLVKVLQWKNFIKVLANIFKTYTCGNRLKDERVLFWLLCNSFQIYWFINNFFDFIIIVQKNHMTQVTSCKQVIIKPNRKLILNHQSKTMLRSKMCFLDFEFDSHIEQMVSYQGMKSGLPCFLLVNSPLSRSLFKNDCLVKPFVSYLSY